MPELTCVLLFGLLLAGAASSGPALPDRAVLEAPQGDLADLDHWIERFRSLRREPELEDEDRVEALLVACRREAGWSPESSERFHRALVGLGAFSFRAVRGGAPASARVRYQRLRRLAVAELERESVRNPRLAGLLASQLQATKKASIARREFLCAFLQQRYWAPTLPALIALGRGAQPELRELAQEALVGWDEDEVHRFFLDGLEQGLVSARRAGLHWPDLAPEWVREPLLAILGKLYVSSNWRNGARAKHLLHALEPRAVVPILIEALAAWDRRTRAGNGSKRIRQEVVEALQRISGRSIGTNYGSWGLWWQAVLEGRIPLSAESEAQGEPPTRAAFFGLRAVTDKVAFVVDRSGSMETAFGTGQRSRYDEAVDQCLRFITQSGEDTRFSIAIFNEKGDLWRKRLIEGSEQNIRSGRRWLEAKRPSGGTGLFAGIREALRLDRDGALDLARVEVDTVIVLCDGATDEGSGWVEAWIRRYNDDAQLVFHCVQIGQGGDDTLQRLAELSGGRFLRVQG